MYDPDEIEEEQRERERRNKINAEFNSFVKRVQVRSMCDHTCLCMYCVRTRAYACIVCAHVPMHVLCAHTCLCMYCVLTRA